VDSQSDAFGYASQIAEYLEWAESTVRQTIHRWNRLGLLGLWEAKGRGKKATWTEEDWGALEQWLKEPCSISSKQLSQRLAKERKVILGAEQVRRILKKKVALEKTEKKTASSREPRVQRSKKKRFADFTVVGGTRGN
jgi:transposase